MRGYNIETISTVTFLVFANGMVPVGSVCWMRLYGTTWSVQVVNAIEPVQFEAVGGVEEED